MVEIGIDTLGLMSYKSSDETLYAERSSITEVKVCTYTCTVIYNLGQTSGKENEVVDTPLKHYTIAVKNILKYDIHVGNHD